MKNLNLLGVLSLALSVIFLSCQKDAETISSGRYGGTPNPQITIGLWEVEESHTNSGPVVGYLGNDQTLTIPQFIESFEVTGISLPYHNYRFKVKRSPQKIDLSQNPNITYIELGVFSNFSRITDIDFGKTIKEIDRFSFSECIRLSQIDFPISLKYIRDNAFEGCTSLSRVRLNSNLLKIEEEVFSNCENLSVLEISRTELPLTQFHSSSFDSNTIDTIYFPIGTDYKNQSNLEQDSAVWIAY